MNSKYHAPLSFDEGVFNCLNSELETTEPQVGLPVEDKLIMVNNNLLNIPKGDNTMKNVNSQTIQQIFNIDEYQTKVAKLNNLKTHKLELIESSKDIKARLATTDKLIENCETQLAQRGAELDNKIKSEALEIETLELTLQQDEETLETKNSKLSNLENIIKELRLAVLTERAKCEGELDIIEFSNPSSSVVEIVEETPSISVNEAPHSSEREERFLKAEDVVGLPCAHNKELTKKQKARKAKHQAHVEAHVAHVDEQQTREKEKAIDETLANPEALQQVAEALDEVYSNSPDEETNLTKFNKLYPSIVLPALPIYPSKVINDVIIGNKEHIGEGKYNLVKAVLELLESSLLLTSKETLIKFVENYELQF